MIGLLILIAAGGSQREILPVPLETPPFQYTPASPAGMECAVSIPDLSLLESSPNDVIDYGEWFDLIGEWPAITFHNGGANNAIRGVRPPNGVSMVLHTPGNGEFHLYQFIFGTGVDIAMYGDPPNRFGVVLNQRILEIFIDPVDPEPTQVLDFLTYAHGPADLAEDASFTFQQLRWAEVNDGVLYVSNAHRTFAESSGGLNAYITAIDLKTLQVLWRSEPLVANSENFVLREDAIISGYGFTDEDDYIYVMDRLSGAILMEIPVPSAPEYFHVQNDSLFVRCYDTDLIFSLK